MVGGGVARGGVLGAGAGRGLQEEEEEEEEEAASLRPWAFWGLGSLAAVGQRLVVFRLLLLGVVFASRTDSLGKGAWEGERGLGWVEEGGRRGLFGLNAECLRGHRCGRALLARGAASAS